MTISTTIRMDEKLKKDAQKKLEALGLNFNTFVVMATKQLIAQNRIPFDLKVPETEEPNALTLAAMERSSHWANHPLEESKEKVYHSANDLFKALDEEKE